MPEVVPELVPEVVPELCVMVPEVVPETLRGGGARSGARTFGLGARTFA